MRLQKRRQTRIYHNKAQEVRNTTLTMLFLGKIVDVFTFLSNYWHKSLKIKKEKTTAKLKENGSLPRSSEDYLFFILYILSLHLLCTLLVLFLVVLGHVSASYWLTLDLWLAKDNRFLNPKSSYERILTS